MAESSERAPVRVAEADHGKVVSLAAGDHLEVRLDVQLGTGYSWSITKIDNRMLKAVGAPTIESPENTRPGSREVQVFRFELRGAGQSTLAFDYSQAWEKQKSPLRVFQVEIHARSR